VWAVVLTSAGMLSLTVEAKANETFGEEILENWLVAGKTTDSIEKPQSTLRLRSDTSSPI